MITAVHPATDDRTEARKFGLCWHPTPFKASWGCFEPEKAAPEPRKPVKPAPAAPVGAPGEIQVTFREHDVAQELFKTGGTNAEIANVLYVCEDTVKTHIKRLLARTGTATRSELIVAHYRGRVRLVPKAQVGSCGMITGRTTMEDAL